MGWEEDIAAAEAVEAAQGPTPSWEADIAAAEQVEAPKPSAPAPTPEAPGALESFARGAGEGFAGAGAMSKIAGLVGSKAQDDPGARIRRERSYEARSEAGRGEEPGAFYGGATAGGVAPWLLPGAKALGVGAKTAAVAGRAAAPLVSRAAKAAHAGGSMVAELPGAGFVGGGVAKSAAKTAHHAGLLSRLSAKGSQAMPGVPAKMGQAMRRGARVPVEVSPAIPPLPAGAAFQPGHLVRAGNALTGAGGSLGTMAAVAGPAAQMALHRELLATDPEYQAAFAKAEADRAERGSLDQAQRERLARQHAAAMGLAPRR